MPGEPKEPLELGITVPKEGLYIREDVDLRCNFILSSFVKKTLKKAHSVLVDRLMAKAERKEMDQALAEQFPIGNKPITPGQAPAPAGLVGMPTHPAYLAHPNNPHYPYEASSPTSAHGQYPPSISSSDPRMSDPRMSTYSQDPRMSYQSQQPWSGYGTQPGLQGQLAPPGYQQPYGYVYPPVPTNNAAMHSQMGFEYEQAMKRAQAPAAWNPQAGWYQPTTEAVEIASSEMGMPLDEKKKVEDSDKKEEEQGNKDKDAVEKQKKKDAESDKLLEAYPQPVRANTYEMM